MREILPASATSALDTLAGAETLLAQVQRQYPETNARVTRLLGVIVPLLPQLNAGDYSGDVAEALFSDGVDLVSTMHSVSSLIAKCTEANRLIDAAVTDPGVPVNLRAQIAAAIGGVQIGEVVKWGVVAVLGYFVLRKALA